MRGSSVVGCALAAVLATVSITLAGPLDEARAFVDAGKLDAAERILEPAAEDPRTAAPATRLLAEIANRRGDYQQGIAWGKKAIAADDTSSDAHYLYAVALRNKMQKVSRLRAMMSLGDYKKELARAIELDGGNIDAREEQIGFFLNAPGIAGGSVEKARELAVELRGIDWRAGTLRLAEIETHEARVDEAAALYEAAAEREPDDPGIRFRLGYARQSQERWSDADAEFRRAAELDEGLAGPVLYQRARTRILGRYEQDRAVALLEEYVAQAPPDARPSPSAAWWRIGNAYEQLGKASSARGAYEQALDLDEDNTEAKKALKALPKG